jgi:hypothetical protein
MTEPQRLLNAGDEMESTLLSSAAGDGPSKHAVKTTLAALGLGSALAAGAGTASASTVSGSMPAATTPPIAGGSTAAAAGKGGLAVVVKWVGVAAIGGLALWGASQLNAGESSQPPEPVAVAPVQADDKAIAVDPAAADPAKGAEEGSDDSSDDGSDDSSDDSSDDGAKAGEATAATDEADKPDVEEPSQPSPASGTAPKAKATSVSVGEQTSVGNLGDEVAALDSARKAMADDPDKALEAIEKYQARFQGGALGQEAEVLRIEALAKSGKLDRARALGQAFLAKHPSSPLAKRVRSVLSTADTD